MVQAAICRFFQGEYEMVGPRVEGEPEAIEPEPRHFEFINRSETRNEPEPRRRPSVYDSLKFERLLEQWRTERDATRSVAQMVLCSSYQKIIGTGRGRDPVHNCAAKSRRR